MRYAVLLSTNSTLHDDKISYTVGVGQCKLGLFRLLLTTPSIKCLMKSLRLRRIKSDRDEIKRECSSSKYASFGGVGFFI